MAGKNVLDFVGVWPTIERIADYVRNWGREERRREAETREAEARVVTTEAEARQAVAEASRTELETMKEAIELAKSCGVAITRLEDEAVRKALMTLAGAARSGRILAARHRRERAKNTRATE